MRAVLAAIFAFGLWMLGSCQPCPDGAAGNSIYCHAANCGESETVCAGACANLNSDRDNCGRCGESCGDGLVCSFGQCVEGCDNDLVSCSGSCVDVTNDPAHCRTCGNTCEADESCNNGVCGCAPNQITCGGVCTNPLIDKMYCGATGGCTGAEAGTRCTADQVCLNGTCVFTTVYRGSLPAGTGRWTYQGTLGINGANADCAAHWPGSAVCSYDKLVLAQSKAELVNALDYNNQPVTQWWLHDPASLLTHQCTSNAEQAAWTYATADQGHVGKYVALDRAAGTISAVITPPPATGCAINRNVACCSINIAP
jgi:hypothetical protein